MIAWLSPKGRAFSVWLALVLAADFASKRVAEHYLWTAGSVDVLGSVLRFTLGHNPHGAMGMSLGSASRVVFSALAVLMTGLLWNYYRHTPPENRLQAGALGAITGGALGNLVDRWRSPLGVVDFIDVGVGQWRFWTFNLADTALTCAGVLLAWLLFREGRRQVA